MIVGEAANRFDRGTAARLRTARSFSRSLGSVVTGAHGTFKNNLLHHGIVADDAKRGDRHRMYAGGFGQQAGQVVLHMPTLPGEKPGHRHSASGWRKRLKKRGGFLKKRGTHSAEPPGGGDATRVVVRRHQASGRTR